MNMRGEPLGRRAPSGVVPDSTLLIGARRAVDAIDRYLVNQNHCDIERKNELRQDAIRRNDELRELLIERGF